MKMSTLAKWAPAKNVSPFIRACRWSLLITGVVYGYLRHRYLARKEVRIQAHENKIRARRDARLAKEKEQRDKQELDDLGREAGVTPAAH